jgi:hypothetical protein
VCDEVSKIKDLRCTYFLCFHAGHQGICLFDPIQVYLVVNWPRKLAVLDFWKKSKISQNVLQKSITFKTDLNFFGRVKNLLGPSRSFSTPNFLTGASRKGFNFMIAFDHKLIFSDIWDLHFSSFMIEGDQKIQTLLRGPRQKVRGAKWSNPPNSTFYAAKKIKISFKSEGFLRNVLRDFWFFQWFTYFEILKNALPIILKSVWWIFKNQKSEMYIFFVFPCWSSGYMPFGPYPSVSGGKLAQKMGHFWFLKTIKNLSKRFAKIHHF